MGVNKHNASSVVTCVSKKGFGSWSYWWCNFWPEFQAMSQVAAISLSLYWNTYKAAVPQSLSWRNGIDCFNKSSLLLYSIVVESREKLFYCESWNSPFGYWNLKGMNFHLSKDCCGYRSLCNFTVLYYTVFISNDQDNIKFIFCRINLNC